MCPLFDHAPTQMLPSWKDCRRCIRSALHTRLNPRQNPHSARGTATPYLLPRFRALALFGRRPPERVVRPSLPASENLHKTCTKPASRAAKKIGGPPPQGRTYSPNFGRLSIKRLGGMTDAAAGVHHASRRRGGRV